MKHRTTLLVAHRVSTVMLADRIVVIEDGRVIEEGTHLELLQRNGVYAELAKVQELEAELEAAFSCRRSPNSTKKKPSAKPTTANGWSSPRFSSS
jgi:ABC-type multidrug transport system ATPase subunit